MFFNNPYRITIVVILIVLTFGSATAATSQRSDKPHVAIFAFSNTGGDCQNKAFTEGLLALGYVEGKNIVIDCQHAGGHQEIDAIVTELISRRPDVIVVFGHAPALAVSRATRDIPIVMSSSGEPVAAGLVASLARPGGNVTGVSYYNTELNAKRLELIKTILPDIRRVGLIRDANAPTHLLDVYASHSATAAKTLGLELRILDVNKPDDLDTLYAQMAKDKIEAVFIMPFHTLFREIPRISRLAKAHRLPTMHCHKSFVPAGGLMFYGVDYAVQHRRMATYVDKILRGAKPADLPVEQPARFEFHLNRATAEELGIKLSPSILMRANKVIE